jgi:hypothetical protein
LGWSLQWCHTWTHRRIAKSVHHLFPLVRLILPIILWWSRINYRFSRVQSYFI